MISAGVRVRFAPSRMGMLQIEDSRLRTGLDRLR
jgi:hypothetical protein